MSTIKLEINQQQAQVIMAGLAELPIKIAASTYEHVFAALSGAQQPVGENVEVPGSAPKAAAEKPAARTKPAGKPKAPAEPVKREKPMSAAIPERYREGVKALLMAHIMNARDVGAKFPSEAGEWAALGCSARLTSGKELHAKLWGAEFYEMLDELGLRDMLTAAFLPVVRPIGGYGRPQLAVAAFQPEAGESWSHGDGHAAMRSDKSELQGDDDWWARDHTQQIRELSGMPALQGPGGLTPPADNGPDHGISECGGA